MGPSRTPSRLARLGAHAALLALLVSMTACITAGRRETHFTDSQLRYTQMVRWSDFKRAEEFVDPESRDAFYEVTDKLGGVRFIDYRIRSIEFDPETNEAVAKVIYSAYKASAPAAIAVVEDQAWHRDEETKTWMVTSTFVEKAYEAEHRN